MESLKAPQPFSRMISFSLDDATGVPPYLQIVQQVESALALGYLTDGDQLPTLKQVVSAVVINPNTVLKAYRELEQRGVVVGKPGLGTFVVSALPAPDLEHVENLMASLQNGWLREAREAKLSPRAVIALFTSAMTEYSDRPAEVNSGR